MEQAPKLLEDGRSKDREESIANEQQLYEQIGSLKVENEWLQIKSASLVKGWRQCIVVGHHRLSIVRQCQLVVLTRSPCIVIEPICDRFRPRIPLGQAVFCCLNSIETRAAI